MRETMKTNSLMTLNIGTWGKLNIYHLNGFVKINDIIKITNARAKEKNPKHREFTLAKYMRSVNLWKFIIELYNVDLGLESSVRNPNTEQSPQNRGSNSVLNQHTANNDYLNLKVPFYDSYNGEYMPKELSTDMLNDYRHGKSGQLKYEELIKMFPDLIYSVNGGENRGTYMDLRITLKLVGMIDSRIEAEIYTLVVSGKLLEFRDLGGVKFKHINNRIDKLEDRLDRNNRGCYKHIATVVNKKVNGEFSKGWNDEIKLAKDHEYRQSILDRCINYIDVGFVKTYPELKDILDKL